MSKKKDIIKTDIQTPDGIAIDWIHDLLYWTDTGFNSIQVASLDGVQRATIISDHLDEPRGIALDPKNGYVDVFFYTQLCCYFPKLIFKRGGYRQC